MPDECPNCSLELETATSTCPRCQYRCELAPEFLWTYFVGVIAMGLGFLYGLFTFFVRDASGEHWSRSLLGWWPLGPWPQEHHWIAFFLEGILWTIAGLGITRRRRLALALLFALLSWDLIWTLLKLTTGEPAPPAPIWAGVLLTLEILWLLTALRVALAFKRLPPRVSLANSSPWKA